MGTHFSHPMTDKSRKIDQAYEMAGLARMDGDKVDEQQGLKEVEQIRREE